jgi:hypothetical protein
MTDSALREAISRAARRVTLRNNGTHMWRCPEAGGGKITLKHSDRKQVRHRR